MSELDQIWDRAEAAHGCNSDPCGSTVCQTQRDRARLLAALDASLALADKWSADFPSKASDIRKAITEALEVIK